MSESLSLRHDRISDFGDLIPRAFLERNEAPWRGRVRSTAAQESYERVAMTSQKLARSSGSRLLGHGERLFHGRVLARGAPDMKSPIVQDVFNNIFALKEIPSWATDEDGKSRYFHPRDRNGKLLRNRYTSDSVQSALADYVAACD